MLAGAIVVAALALVVVPLLFVTGQAEDGAAPAPTPTPLPTPTPTPTPGPVAGEVETVGVADLSTTDTGLFHPGQAGNEPVPVDDEAVDAFVAELRAWLDDALTRVHTQGRVGDLAEGLTGPEELLLLGEPSDRIVEARYRFRVGVRGTPEWAEVQVRAITAGGADRRVMLAVLPGSPPVPVAASEAGEQG